MSEEKKPEKPPAEVHQDPNDSGTDLSEYARHRTPAPPPLSGSGRFLRGFFRILLRVIGIALGIALLLFFLVLGVCFIA
jgi:hypothetical protein